MKSLAPLILSCFAICDGLVPTPNNNIQLKSSIDDAAVMNRRNAFFTAVTKATAFSATGVAVLGNTQSAVASDKPNGFVGTFSDPINHPGGKREIKILEGQDAALGDYKLAQVIGGGGGKAEFSFNFMYRIIILKVFV